MIDTEKLCANVDNRIRVYRAQCKRCRLSVLILALICLCACAAVSTYEQFRKILPLWGSDSASALDSSVTATQATLSFDSTTFVLDGIAQDEFKIYLLLHVQGSTEHLNDFSFSIRPKTYVSCPSAYLRPAGCGVIYYEESTILLECKKNYSDQLPTVLCIDYCGSKVNQHREVPIEANTYPNSVSHQLESSLTVNGIARDFYKVTLTPFCAILWGSSESTPSTSAALASCLAGSVYISESIYPANVHWFVKDGKVGMIYEWNGVVSADEVSGLAVANSKIIWK